MTKLLPTPDTIIGAAVSPPPGLLGEDRLFGGNALFVDLVPQSCWFTSARSCLAPQDWRQLSLEVRYRAQNRCEICGTPEDRARKVYLEAHERWTFNETTHTQKLMRIIALCKSCHEVTHWGLTRLKGRERLAHGMDAVDEPRHQSASSRRNCPAAARRSAASRIGRPTTTASAPASRAARGVATRF
jgi:hypothetical protein